MSAASGVRLDRAGTAWRLDGPSAAPVALLLHGVGLDLGMWDRVLPALTGAGLAVLRLDLLGHARSADPPGARTLDDFAAQAEALLDHLAVASVRLVGFSLGALVAIRLAVRAPERVERLALLHAVFERDAAARAAIRARCEAVARSGPLANVEAALERWFSPGYLQRHPAVAESIRRTLASHPGEGYLKAYRVLAEAEREIDAGALARVTCPALVLTGERDPNSTPAMAARIAALLPQAECRVLAGARHMAPVEHADEVARPLATFLAAPGDAVGRAPRGPRGSTMNGEIGA